MDICKYRKSRLKEGLGASSDVKSVSFVLLMSQGGQLQRITCCFCGTSHIRKVQHGGSVQNKIEPLGRGGGEDGNSR